MHHDQMLCPLFIRNFFSSAIFHCSERDWKDQKSFCFLVIRGICWMGRRNFFRIYENLLMGSVRKCRSFESDSSKQILASKWKSLRVMNTSWSKTWSKNISLKCFVRNRCTEPEHFNEAFEEEQTVPCFQRRHSDRWERVWEMSIEMLNFTYGERE